MKKWLVVLVILANLAGAYFGFFVYYSEQLSTTPLPLIPFVADSPLSTLLFAIALLLILIGRPSNSLNFLSSAYVLKYGIWTLFILSYYRDYFFTPANQLLYTVMFITHIGMVAESFALISQTKISKLFLPISLGWFLFNDFMDYVVGTLPSAIPAGNLGLVFGATVAISIFSCLILNKFYGESRTEKKFLAISRILF